MNLYTQHVDFLKKREIKKLFDLATKELKITKSVGVSLSFVSEDEIKELNEKHRNVDRVTDVLSFPMLDIKEGESLDEFHDEIFDEIFLGDIVICKKRAREQACLYGHSVKREICFLALHGLLHLLGYDHMEKDEEKRMMSVAERILQKAKIGR